MMRHRPYLVGAAMGLFACVATAGTPAMATPCTNLQSLQLRDTTITSAADNTTGVFVVPGSSPPTTISGLPAFLPGYRDPHSQLGLQHQDRGLAARDDVERQVPGHRRRRLPGRDHLRRTRRWNPGGLCRDQQRSRHRGLGMQPALLRLGRQHGQSAGRLRSAIRRRRRPACSGIPSGSRIYGYRAIHLMTLRGKQIAGAFLRARTRTRPISPDAPPAARNALMEAQRFPDDYDGILARRGGVQPHPPAHGGTFAVAGHPCEPRAASIQAGQMTLINQAVQAQCVGQDGGAGTDPFLTDPRDCHFDPKALLCTGGKVPSRMPDRRPGHDHAEEYYAGTIDPVNGQPQSIRAPRACNETDNVQALGLACRSGFPRRRSTACSTGCSARASVIRRAR